jgi:hypothetical protein
MDYMLLRLISKDSADFCEIRGVSNRVCGPVLWPLLFWLFRGYGKVKNGLGPLVAEINYRLSYLRSGHGTERDEMQSLTKAKGDDMDYPFQQHQKQRSKERKVFEPEKSPDDWYTGHIGKIAIKRQLVPRIFSKNESA